MSDPRYPIGQFRPPSVFTSEVRSALIEQVESTPKNLRAAVKGLSEDQLDSPYREGGWSVRQVVHHLPDSHMNAYVRFKLAITEDEPTIKPYQEALWAELPDARSGDIAPSLDLLAALHQRWVGFLRGLQESDYQRLLFHPEQGTVSLDTMLALYAWHGRHHVAHITGLREYEGW